MEDGYDTLTTQEPIELDIAADGNAPFRYVLWFSDAPEPDSGVYDPIRAEHALAIAFWKANS